MACVVKNNIQEESEETRMRRIVAIALVVFVLLSYISAFAAEYKDKGSSRKVEGFKPSKR